MFHRFFSLIAIVASICMNHIPNIAAAEYVVVDYFGYDDTTCSGPPKFRTHALMNTCIYFDKNSIETVNDELKLRKQENKKKLTANQVAFNMIKSHLKGPLVLPINFNSSHNNGTSVRKTKKALRGTEDPQAGLLRKFTYSVDGTSITIGETVYSATAEEFSQFICNEDGSYVDASPATLPFNQCYSTDSVSTYRDKFGYSIIRPIATEIAYPIEIEGVVVRSVIFIYLFYF